MDPKGHIVELVSSFNLKCVYFRTILLVVESGIIITPDRKAERTLLTGCILISL